MRRCSGLLTVSQRKFGKKWEDAILHLHSTRRRGGRPKNYVIGAVGGEVRDRHAINTCSSLPLSGNGSLSHVARRPIRNPRYHRRRRRVAALNFTLTGALYQTLWSSEDCYGGAGGKKERSRTFDRSGQGPRQMARKRKMIGNIENSARPISIEKK